MKLFQIEEPDGSPADPDAPGAAIGIDASGIGAVVAVAVGGNAVLLPDRAGFEQDLRVPPPEAAIAAWQAVFEGTRLRAERALAQPVTHAVLVLADAAEPALAAQLLKAGEAAGLALLRILGRRDLDAGPPACAAAVLAEDLAPRPPERPLAAS